MSNFTISKPIETVQKQTTSKCIFCHELVPATVVKVVRAGREQIIMRRTCEKHGLHETVISTNARFYWRAEGNPLNRGKNASGGCGCGTACSAGGGKDGFLGDNALNEAKRGTIEKLSTCLALIEIADSCNLSCPTCFADSPLGISGEKLKYHSFDKITKNIQGVIDQKGHIEILQFSGGEPTIHPEFFRLVAWVRSHPKIDYLLINTNGVRLSKDAEFVEGMGRMFKKFDNIIFNSK